MNDSGSMESSKQSSTRRREPMLVGSAAPPKTRIPRHGRVVKRGIGNQAQDDRTCPSFTLMCSNNELVHMTAAVRPVNASRWSVVPVPPLPDCDDAFSAKNRPCTGRCHRIASCAAHIKGFSQTRQDRHRGRTSIVSQTRRALVHSRLLVCRKIRGSLAPPEANP